MKKPMEKSKAFEKAEKKEGKGIAMAMKAHKKEVKEGKKGK